VLRDYPWASLVNYGSIPQTWEDPNRPDEETRLPGDKDPVDLLDLSEYKNVNVGDVYRVKVIGALAMIDQGEEMDWKVLALNADDPLAANVSNAEDLEEYMPGKISEVRELFRTYKTVQGKDNNTFAYNESVTSPEFTMKVIKKLHGYWCDAFTMAQDATVSDKPKELTKYWWGM